MKNQKGFIQIPLLIIVIASVVTVSVVAGVVLYKQGKLASITANISQIFKGSGEQSALETEGIEITSDVASGQPTKERPTANESVCEPAVEVCDNIDNNCDGQIDEGLTRQCGTSDVGICQFGTQTCNLGSWGMCVGVIEPREETCDQEDNDCDGKTDENYVCGVPKIEVNSCININCPSCQYCLNGSCVIRPDGYNDCGSECQRCINGSCQDYNVVCPDCQRCSSDACVNYCQGTDANCGCTSCTNCNTLDKCSGNSYLDYYCSGASCVFNSNDCSDCSCSCGGYNVAENIANGNCADGKDNDCDGYVDSEDSECISTPLPITYLELNKSYISKTGITVTVTNIEKVEEVGSYKYIISYKQENKTTDKELDEGTFKMFFEDGTGLNQYGFFDKLFPSENITRTYTFQILKTQKPFCIEFNDDIDAGLEGAFFRNQPAIDTLKWSIE